MGFFKQSRNRFELEETFNITFSTDEIAVMDCLSNIIDITKRKVS